MSPLTVTKTEIIDELEGLPPESLPELQAFIEFLRFKSEKEPKKLIQLGGLWKDLPPATEENIAEARREMWQQALAATFGMWADRDDIDGDSVSYVQSIRRGHRLNDMLEQVDEAD